MARPVEARSGGSRICFASRGEVRLSRQSMHGVSRRCELRSGRPETARLGLVMQVLAGLSWNGLSGIGVEWSGRLGWVRRGIGRIWFGWNGRQGTAVPGKAGFVMVRPSRMGFVWRGHVRCGSLGIVRIVGARKGSAGLSRPALEW